MADDEALRVSSSGSPPWLVIAGEIDESTYPILLAGLAAAEGYREIRIDLSGVRYCDLAGLHRIVGLTGSSSARGRPIRRVVLHAVPSWLADILQILGWDTTPGIALEELLLSGSGQAVSTGWIRGDHSCGGLGSPRCVRSFCAAPPGA